MAVDYDAPRVAPDSDTADESLEALGVQRREVQTALIDVEDDLADAVFLPDGDLSGEELTVRVVPQQADEFVCRSCFLVHHRHLQAGGDAESPICVDCAA